MTRVNVQHAHRIPAIQYTYIIIITIARKNNRERCYGLLLFYFVLQNVYGHIFYIYIIIYIAYANAYCAHENWFFNAVAVIFFFPTKAHCKKNILLHTYTYCATTQQSSTALGTFNPEILPKFVFNTTHRARKTMISRRAQYGCSQPKGRDEFRL